MTVRVGLVVHRTCERDSLRVSSARLKHVLVRLLRASLCAEVYDVYDVRVRVGVCRFQLCVLSCCTVSSQ